MAQLEQIYNTTLATIICQNSDNVKESQKYLMRIVSKENPIVSCEVLNTFSFEPWIDNRSTGKSSMVKMNNGTSKVVAIPAN